MAILKGWHHALGRRASNNSSVTILDQGPIFMLAWLYEFGPESLKNKSVERWWDSMYKQWASTLDMVIWLDAPDTILVERIHARSKWHLVKGESEQEATEFLARSRTCYEQTIGKLTANSGPEPLRFDTDQESLDQIVDKVLAAFNLEHKDRP
jgi:thymidylate kinase